MHLSSGDDELAVFDGDVNSLSGSKAGVLDPPAGELHRRIKNRRPMAFNRGLAGEKIASWEKFRGDGGVKPESPDG